MNFNTYDCSTREEALQLIIQNMKKTKEYTPLGYYLDHSGCSCCRADYFYIMFLYKSNYQMIIYNANIKHDSNCRIIRCSCYDPFDWKNINPEEKEIEEKSIEYWLEKLISVDKNNDLWKSDFEYYFYYHFQQEKENNSIFEYNESNEDNVNNKNYNYYF